ncbi:cyclase [Kitasatospora sp. GP82]|uniref:cyclase n=1 Tax=Kitasatospora sp. GP82 TaxID=3035089 RepID=UPI0024765FCD|nr:cyclase [Kitasatospora sp. GP82]MDH6125344.1 dehydratase [Kitasatospora sp. GP82]
MRTTSVLPRVSIVLAGGLVAAGLFTPPASAADTSVDLACQATPPIGSAQTFSLHAGVNATAPGTVASGSQFSVTLAPDPLAVPTSVSGYTLKSISDIQLTVPVPANTTLIDESIAGGSDPGSASVTVNGGNVIVTVTGPIAGGSTFTLPALTLDLTAGASGSTVQTALGGTSYSSPGLTFTASVPVGFFNVDVPTACFPSSNEILSSTSVS